MLGFVCVKIRLWLQNLERMSSCRDSSGDSGKDSRSPLIGSEGPQGWAWRGSVSVG